MSQRVVLWRHGRTAFNVQLRMQGRSDIDLDEVGRLQAKAAAAVLAELKPDLIVSSPLRRAADTAEFLGLAAGVPVDRDQRLQERSYGEWEGLTIDEVQQRWPAEYAIWQAGGDPDGAGIESRPEAARRVVAAVHDGLARLPAHGTVVVVSHGGAITCGLTALLGLDVGAWHGLRGLDNCHWSMLGANHGRVPAWRLLGHNLGVER